MGRYAPLWPKTRPGAHLFSAPTSGLLIL